MAFDGGDSSASAAAASSPKRIPEARASGFSLVACQSKAKNKKVHVEAPCSTSNSSSSSYSTSSYSPSRRSKGLRVRRPSASPPISQRRRDDGLQELALPLGMSFAAIIAQFSDGKKLGEKISVHQTTRICVSVIEESIKDTNGDRYESFMRNFENSFGTTLKTLKVLNEASEIKEDNTSTIVSSSSDDGQEERCSLPCISEESQSNVPSHSSHDQLIVRNLSSHQLAQVSQRVDSSEYGQSMLTTFERSIVEQTRSNDLKEIEINLAMKRLQLKQSQLALNSYANLLEKIKISMGISKATFKEEKLRNQMQDTRYAEFQRTCIDLLVAGLIIMCCFLAYGASIFSYQRITEATASCMPNPKESKSWWIPKQVSSFSSNWHMLRCQVLILSRMTFGILMILAVAYALFQRSSMVGQSMPVTFILLLLGAACGFAGKLCVDTLGGSGYCFLVYWEIICLLHFFANMFPASMHYILYGSVFTSERMPSTASLPYWIRRLTFYIVLVLILPILSGLVPFASLSDWKEHFSEKIFRQKLVESDDWI